MLEIKIRTWSCKSCNYRQDFEPTVENQIKHFKGTEHFCGKDICPSCGGEMKKETNEAKKCGFSIPEESDEIEVKEKDSEGKELVIKRKVRVGEFRTIQEIQELRDKYEDKS